MERQEHLHHVHLYRWRYRGSKHLHQAETDEHRALGDEDGYCQFIEEGGESDVIR